jgi:hypothetical protein
MAMFLFWNANRKPVLPLVKALCAEHDVDVLVLAESPASEVELLTDLNTEGDVSFFPPPQPWQSDLVTVVTTYPTEYVRPIARYGGAAVLRLVPPIGSHLTLVMVHLASKLYQSDADQAALAGVLASDIARVEQNAGDSRTVVFGDFNMNPFEAGVVGATYLHAAMTREIAGRDHRVVQGREYPFLYNPMWNFFGDLSPGPPGTCYYDQSGRPLNYFWNLFDQVLIRPGLIHAFRHDRLAVLTSAGGASLLSTAGRPEPSDHLPLLFQIDL